MKVSKESVQKIFLAAIFCMGGGYYYFAQMLAPLAVKEKTLGGQITALEAKIRDGRAKITQTRNMAAADAHASQVGKAFEVMQAKIPNGQPVAWLPTRLGELFKARGVARQTYRCENSGGDVGIPGFQSSTWVVDFPSASFIAFGKALAGLENEDGLSQVLKFQIASTGKDPENHHAEITFSTFVKSEK